MLALFYLITLGKAAKIENYHLSFKQTMKNKRVLSYATLPEGWYKMQGINLMKIADTSIYNSNWWDEVYLILWRSLRLKSQRMMTSVNHRDVNFITLISRNFPCRYCMSRQPSILIMILFKVLYRWVCIEFYASLDKLICVIISLM